MNYLRTDGAALRSRTRDEFGGTTTKKFAHRSKEGGATSTPNGFVLEWKAVPEDAETPVVAYMDNFLTTRLNRRWWESNPRPFGPVSMMQNKFRA